MIKTLITVIAAGALAASSPPQTSLTVHMRSFAFTPQSATVPAGSTVAFVNDDSAIHNVTDPDDRISSGDIANGSTWRYTFSNPGDYRYVCTYHPWMKGVIHVTLIH